MNPDVKIDEKGNVPCLEDNLPALVEKEDFMEDIGGGNDYKGAGRLSKPIICIGIGKPRPKRNINVLIFADPIL